MRLLRYGLRIGSKSIGVFTGCDRKGPRWIIAFVTIDEKNHKYRKHFSRQIWPVFQRV